MFSVGDKVIGNTKSSTYIVTSTGWIGSVKDIINDKHIRVVDSVGNTYNVLSERFDLLEPVKIQTKITDTSIPEQLKVPAMDVVDVRPVMAGDLLKQIANNADSIKQPLAILTSLSISGNAEHIHLNNVIGNCDISDFERVVPNDDDNIYIVAKKDDLFGNNKFFVRGMKSAKIVANEILNPNISVTISKINEMFQTEMEIFIREFKKKRHH